MTTKFKIENPDTIQMTLTLTMPLGQWRKLKDETERATEELGQARKEFAGLLQILQVHEDFIDELVQIRQAQKAIDVIRQLTKDVRGASDQLKKLIGAIKPPGA